MGGTKSSPMPSTVQLPASVISPVLTSGASTEPIGSASTISVFGEYLREEAPEPGQRAARADADDHRVDVAVELFPEFRPGRRLVRERVGRIGELVDVERAGRLRRDLFRHVLVIFRMPLADVGARQPDFGAQRPQMLHLLARHLVGHDQHDAVALRDADLREAEPGVAGGRLDDRAALLQPAVLLGVGDHRQRDAVLDRAARILALELHEQAAFSRVELRQFDDRRLADQVQHGRKRRLEPRSRGGCARISGLVHGWLQLVGRRAAAAHIWQIWPWSTRKYNLPNIWSFGRKMLPVDMGFVANFTCACVPRLIAPGCSP